MAKDLSEEATQIAAEKPDLWEYRLALAVLQTEMRPILQRWDALKRKLYSNAKTRVARGDFIEWMQDRLSETTDLTESFTAITNEEFERAWGAPGEAGDADAIIATSRLYAEMCASALAWEERVRFAVVDKVFEPVRAMFVGVAGTFIDEAKKLPAFLSAIVNDPEVSGTHSLDMVLKLPDGWAERVGEAVKTASERLEAGE